MELSMVECSNTDFKAEINDLCMFGVKLDLIVSCDWQVGSQAGDNGASEPCIDSSNHVFTIDTGYTFGDNSYMQTEALHIAKENIEDEIYKWWMNQLEDY